MIIGRQEPEIRNAIRYIHNVSCIRLVDRSANDDHWVRFEAGPGCMSLIGMNKEDNGEPQPIILEREGCMGGRIVHEILHALGFLHMHMALERWFYFLFSPQGNEMISKKI